MATEKRHDIHRRGAIQPHLYNFVGWYYIGIGGGRSIEKTSDTIKAFLTSDESYDFKATVFGDFGQCGVCGARFAMGELWQHEETRDMVHIGCDCCDKYALVSGTNWTALEDERRRAHLARQTAAKRSAQREKLFKAYPGIEEAFKTNHYIVHDILRRFENGTAISEKQIALVFKIAKEEVERAAKRAAEKTEAHVPVPVSDKRTTVRGLVVSKKLHDSPWGEQVKITVKVETTNGSYLVWGTAPTITEADGNVIAASQIEKGDTVEFDAKLVKGERDEHFGFFKRPTKASVISRATKEAA